MNGDLLKHDPNPLCFGLTPNWTLLYEEHLSKTAAKLKSRDNLLSKLAGSSEGANAKTLTQSLNTAVHAAWLRSSHTASNASQRAIFNVHISCKR